MQFYASDESVLLENVVHYLREGLDAGMALRVVATAEHIDAFARGLAAAGARIEQPVKRGQLAFLDTSETLSRILVDGYPDRDRFATVVGTMVRDALEVAGGRGVRAYGEMVGVLWQANQFPAAIRLEQLWDKLLAEHDFALLCGYPIDIFSRAFEPGIVDALLCAHSHLLPSGRAGNLEDALVRAIDESLGAFGRKADPSRSLRPAWAQLPRGEAIILWLRANVPERADDILARAKEYYTLSTRA